MSMGEIGIEGQHNDIESYFEKIRNDQDEIAKKGGFLTMPFILVSEACDKLASDGLNKNLMNYLTKEVNLTVTKAANTITNYSGTASLTPLLGAFISDSFLGRFWTISIASLFCFLGTTMFTLAAALPQLTPTCKEKNSCQSPNSGHLAMLYTPLLLLALGSGGIRSCLAVFGADQLAQYNTKQSVNTDTKKWNFFNWYFSVMAISVLFAATVLVYVQDNVGWVWGFGILSVATLASMIIFLSGRSLYMMIEPCGSPYTRLLQVAVAAFRKRDLAMVSHPKFLYENDAIDKYSDGDKLQHSSHFKFLDKAAIVTEGDLINTPQNLNLWRLATVHRVEELKSLLRMIPIWASGIIYFMSSAQEKTFSIEQANTMNRHLTKSFIIPSGSMSVFKMASMLLTIVLYDPIIVPLAKRYIKFSHTRSSFLLKMGIGLGISILATLVAGIVEMKRKQTLGNSKEPISVFWLVPQYSLDGIAEAFLSVGHLEFFYDQSPKSMRSTATALFWTSSSIGNYVSSFIVSIVHKSSHWLPDNLNQGKLERFYWLITIFQVMNFVYYLICARLYTFKAVQVHCENNDGRVEHLNQV